LTVVLSPRPVPACTGAFGQSRLFEPAI